jgi:predicted RNase H-like HicB family nuclease
MSAKQKKRRNIARPFEPALLARARQIAAAYQIVVRPEDGEYYGRGLELPGAMDDGRTPDQCVEKTREAMVAMVAYMLEQGQTPPPPAATGARQVQINIRMSIEEKLLIEARARQKGYSSLSDYVRATALAGN